MHPNCSLLFLILLPDPQHLSSPPDPLLLCFSEEKSRPSRDISQSYSKTRNEPLYKDWKRHPNGRKRVPRADERVTDTPTPLFGVPQEYQVNNCNIDAEDLMQTHTGS